MKTYTYEFVYSDKMNTKIAGCKQIKFDTLSSSALAIFNTPEGRQAINMLNVLYVNEIEEKED